MPKENFFKLKLEKREKIILAARDEFSLKPYDEVSINEIVSRSNISRGSFYLYFEDKWDIYSHLLKCTFNKVLERIKETLARGNNIFFAVMDVYDYIIIESNLDDSIGFIANILRNANPINFIQVHNLLSEGEKHNFVQDISFVPEDYSITTQIEFRMLRKMLITNLVDAMSQVLVFNRDPNVVREELRISFNILKYGTYK